MRRPPAVLTLALALAGAAPAVAARPAQPLVDLAPQATAFADRVGPPASSPRAAGDSPAAAYAAADGQSVSVRFSGSYQPDPTIAQTYVDFLGGLPHGTELKRLKVYIATPAEVQDFCGGVEGTLACYDPSTSTMTVPGEQTADTGDGVTTSYVIAHEYGHHIARWRTNAPFAALNFGPKYWASYEQVCLNTIKGKLAPGDEGQRYLANPGEAWADTYAHLKYPAVAWQFTSLLRPSQGSKAAALRDVLTPWTTPAAAVFHGRFVPGATKTLAFPVTLRLDGTLRVKLTGPQGANFDIALSSLGRNQGGSSGPTAQDAYRVKYACREVDTENLTVKIKRRHGFGAFTATVSYAG
ncbi:MAG: hypothetical protein JWM73_2201 [Solirubrobacterales bacterium]|nr:hypothetical protein [Solirubrobacterales bacterium]